MHDSRFQARVACITNQSEIGLGPFFVNVPGGAHGCAYVVTALNHYAGDVFDLVHVPNDLIIRIKETTVDEKVALYARKRQGVLIGIKVDVPIGIRPQGNCRKFPPGPCTRAFDLLFPVLTRQTLVMRRNEIAAFIRWYRRHVTLKEIRIHMTRAILIEPQQLGSTQREQAAQDQFCNPLRMGLGVGQCERTAPRSAEYLPFIDTALLAKEFDVRNKMPGRVVDQRTTRCGFTAAALIEEDDPLCRRVKKSSHFGTARSTRSAVQENDRLATRVAALLVVNLMYIRHGQHAGFVRLYVRIEFAFVRRFAQNHMIGGILLLLEFQIACYRTLRHRGNRNYL